MAKEQLLLAFFENEAAADAAVQDLKHWDKVSEDIKLGAIGVLVKNEKAKIKTHKLGARKTTGGAVLFGLAALLTGGTLIGLGVVGGSVVGAGIGALFHKGLKISKEEMERLNRELDGGKAAIGIMIPVEEAEPVKAKLTQLGGSLEAYEVMDEAIQEAVDAATALPEEPAETEAPAEAAREG